MATILLVDPSPAFRQTISATLRREGHQTISVGRGEEALNVARSQRPDLIVFELEVPAMEGLSFLDQVRQDRDLRDVPVMLVTSVTDKRELDRAKELGIQDHLTKSQFSLDELRASIKSHLPTDA